MEESANLLRNTTWDWLTFPDIDDDSPSSSSSTTPPRRICIKTGFVGDALRVLCSDLVDVWWCKLDRAQMLKAAQVDPSSSDKALVSTFTALLSQRESTTHVNRRHTLSLAAAKSSPTPTLVLHAAMKTLLAVDDLLVSSTFSQSQFPADGYDGDVDTRAGIRVETTLRLRGVDVDAARSFIRDHMLQPWHFMIQHLLFVQAAPATQAPYTLASQSQSSSSLPVGASSSSSMLVAASAVNAASAYSMSQACHEAAGPLYADAQRQQAAAAAAREQVKRERLTQAQAASQSQLQSQAASLFDDDGDGGGDGDEAEASQMGVPQVPMFQDPHSNGNSSNGNSSNGHSSDNGNGNGKSGESIPLIGAAAAKAEVADAAAVAAAAAVDAEAAEEAKILARREELRLEMEERERKERRKRKKRGGWGD
jgi:hypothetical protein